AHSIGIPAVFGVTGALDRIHPGTMMVMDGTRGTVLLSPTSQEIAAAKTHELWDPELAGPLEGAAAQPAITTDGRRVALRVCLDRPEIFRTQIRAALRAARHADIQLMIPLVTRLDELDRTRAIVAEEATNLARDGVAAATSVPVGVMVETPAAAVMADQLA